MPTTTMSPRFRRMMDESQALVLKPTLEAYLGLAKFPNEFSVTFRKAGEARKPDGFFHPSTHPRWPARMLYLYLTQPDRMVPEMLDYESRMAVTMGTAVHAFFQMCLRDAKVMAPLGKEICKVCGKPHGTRKNQCDEFEALDGRLGARGHMDGVLVIDQPGTLWTPGTGGLEFKTINPNACFGLTDLNLEWLKTKKPDYYAQVQEYMRITGLRQFIVLFAILGYPWKLVEIQVPYDIGASMLVENKYRAVRDAQVSGRMPDACCAPLSKESKACVARYACPIGQMVAS